jgi:hypothetical protein
LRVLLHTSKKSSLTKNITNKAIKTELLLIYHFDRLRMVVLKVKIVQKYKEPKVEMYKSSWGLVFKCNGSRIQFNLIQFSQEYSNQKNVRKEKKKSNKNTRYNEVRLKNTYVSGTLNLQQLRLSRNTKK